MDTGDISIYDSPGVKSKKSVYNMLKQQGNNLAVSTLVFKPNNMLKESFNEVEEKLGDQVSSYPGPNEYGISELRGRLTFEILKRKFPWVLKAKLHNAVIGIAPAGNFVWYSGSWLDGTWKNGVWRDGTFSKGVWLDGSWSGGYFFGTKWRRGTFRQGRFGPKAEWLGGTFEYGTFFGNWRGGKWLPNKPICWQPTARINGKVSATPPQEKIAPKLEGVYDKLVGDKVSRIGELKVGKNYIIYDGNRYKDNCKLVETSPQIVFDCEGSLKDDDNEFIFDKGEMQGLIKSNHIYNQK